MSLQIARPPNGAAIITAESELELERFSRMIDLRAFTGHFYRLWNDKFRRREMTPIDCAVSTLEYLGRKRARKIVRF